MMWIGIESADADGKRAQAREANLQAVRDALKRPMVISSNTGMRPIQAELMQTAPRKLTAEIASLRKHESPASPQSPAISKPLRSGAEISRDLTAKIAARMRAKVQPLTHFYDGNHNHVAREATSPASPRSVRRA